MSIYICIYIYVYEYVYEEATLGVFRLGRVKSGKTLGNGCSSTKSLLGSWETWVVSKNLE